MPRSCDPARPEMTKSLLPQSPAIPQQPSEKDRFPAESHTLSPYAVPPSSPQCPPLSEPLTYTARVCHGADDRCVPRKGFAPFHGTKLRPSGCLPSERDRPLGSLVTGMPAETKVCAIRPFTALCLAVFPGAFLQTKLWTTTELTSDPHRR